MTLTTILLAGAGTLALLAAATQALPGRVQVERKATVAAASAQVLALLDGAGPFQTINPYRTADPKLAITLFGPDRGPGSGFRFDGKDGRGTQVVESVAIDRVTYAIDMGTMGKPRQTITATPVAAGTEVTWGMQADLGRNPLARLFGLFLPGMIGPTLEQGLTNIATATKA